MKKNIFGSNIYFFILKLFKILYTYFLKVKTMFFDPKQIFLIANTFSLRLPVSHKFSLSEYS